MMAEGQGATGTDRRRFIAALALFLLWVTGLGVLALTSGRRPEPSPAPTIEGR
jgi:hypothetical protein